MKQMTLLIYTSETNRELQSCIYTHTHTHTQTDIWGGGGGETDRQTDINRET